MAKVQIVHKLYANGIYTAGKCKQGKENYDKSCELTANETIDEVERWQTR